MTRKDALIKKIIDCGGWPYAVTKIEVDLDCRVFFDGVIIPRFLQSMKSQIKDFSFNNVIITEKDLINRK